MSVDKTLLRERLRANGLTIRPDDLEKLNLFVTNILVWNGRINLISRRDEGNVWSKHVLISLSFLCQRRLASGSRIADIGSGGGFPAIPLAILHPNIRFFLIDSIQKKIRALESIVRELELTNISTICARAETLSLSPDYHHRFHYVTCRGVGSIVEVFALSKGLLVPIERDLDINDSRDSRAVIDPGSILAFKGGDIRAELRKATERFHPRCIEVLPLQLPRESSLDLLNKYLIILHP